MDNLSRRRVLGLILMGAASALVIAMPAAAAGPARLAIQGYDPVAYFTTGRPTPGKAEIAYEWDEHRYLFSRPEHREMFRADPVRYAPQFANFCAMALTRGEVHEANPEYWLISGGKLYIFALPIGPEAFQQDLAGNLIKANQNRVLIQAN